MPQDISGVWMFFLKKLWSNSPRLINILSTKPTKSDTHQIDNFLTWNLYSSTVIDVLLIFVLDSTHQRVPSVKSISPSEKQVMAAEEVRCLAIPLHEAIGRTWWVVERACGDDKVSALNCWMFDVWFLFFFTKIIFLWELAVLRAIHVSKKKKSMCLLTPIPGYDRFECCCGDVPTCRSLCCSFLPAICWWRPSFKSVFNCYSCYPGFCSQKKRWGWKIWL